MTARTRLRLLAATALALTTLVLTGCDDGEGVRDEGPATPKAGAAFTTYKAEGRPDDNRAASKHTEPQAKAGTSFGFGPYLF
jgi:hypothetical protein